MRKKPYTETGIRRIPCFRCKVNKSVYKWQICSDHNKFRGLCADCDIEMNKIYVYLFFIQLYLSLDCH